MLSTELPLVRSRLRRALSPLAQSSRPAGGARRHFRLAAYSSRRPSSWCRRWRRLWWRRRRRRLSDRQTAAMLANESSERSPPLLKRLIAVAHESHGPPILLRSAACRAAAAASPSLEQRRRRQRQRRRRRRCAKIECARLVTRGAARRLLGGELVARRPTDDGRPTTADSRYQDDCRITLFAGCSPPFEQNERRNQRAEHFARLRRFVGARKRRSCRENDSRSSAIRRDTFDDPSRLFTRSPPTSSDNADDGQTAENCASTCFALTVALKGEFSLLRILSRAAAASKRAPVESETVRAHLSRWAPRAISPRSSSTLQRAIVDDARGRRRRRQKSRRATASEDNDEPAAIGGGEIARRYQRRLEQLRWRPRSRHAPVAADDDDRRRRG